MLFNSLNFLLLFSFTFFVYYLPISKKIQVWLLIVASLVFYAYSQPVLLVLLISSISINTAFSYAIVYRHAWNKKLLATIGVVVNLVVIAFFKYSGMLTASLGLATTDIGQFFITLPLPLGISFFTFEGISLLVDTYKEKEIAEYKSVVVKSIATHFSNTLLFVSFFPHLIAGPILKAHEFYPQIGVKYFNQINWDKAFRQLLVGYFLKMVIADNLKDQTFWIAYPYFLKSSSETLLVMLFGYSIQIFADFAGYSLIALGLATMLGYELKGNFNFPYIATSFSDFWRRWHISLSSFLKEYLYIPLGGNRKGKLRTYLNLFLTMALGGLWHGAGWSYAIWGMAHGVFLAIEKLMNDYVEIRVGFLLRVFKWFMVFSLVTFAWLLFKLPEFSYVLQYFSAIGSNFDLPSDERRISLILCYSAPVVVYNLFALIKEQGLGMRFKNFEWIMYGLMLFLLVANSGSSSEFIYFQF